MYETKQAVIPFPLPQRGRIKYPFATMRIGDVFIVPVAEAPREHAFRIYLFQKNRQLNRRFQMRKLEDGSFEVYRRS
jgi:hypothetical protein